MRKLWEGWKELAGIGDFQSRFILTIFYFTIMVPFAVMTKLSGKSLIARLDTWQAREENKITLESAKLQF